MKTRSLGIILTLATLLPTLSWAQMAAVRTIDRLYAWNACGSRVVDMDPTNIHDMMSVENRLALMDNFGTLTVLNDNGKAILTERNTRSYKMTSALIATYSAIGGLRVFNAEGQALFSDRNVQRYGISDTLVAYESMGTFYVRNAKGNEVWRGLRLSQVAVSNAFAALIDGDDVRIIDTNGRTLVNAGDVFQTQISDRFAFVRERSGYAQLIGENGDTLLSGFSIELLGLTESVALIGNMGRFQIIDAKGNVTFDDRMPIVANASGKLVTLEDNMGMTLINGETGRVLTRMSQSSVLDLSSDRALVRTAPYWMSIIDGQGREVKRINTLDAETVRVADSFYAMKTRTANVLQLFDVRGMEMASVMNAREFVLPTSQEKIRHRAF